LIAFAATGLLATPTLAFQERRPVDEVTPMSRVVGRVVDAKGGGVRDAKVHLYSVDGAWRQGESKRDFETRTDAHGRFELVVPTPTSDWISLLVEPTAHLDVAGRDFGPAGGRDQPRLKSGDNDLGEFKLQATGAFAGRVVDVDGKPVAQVEVRLDGSFPGGRGRGARSNERGEYEVGHVPSGHYSVEALSSGFVLAKRAGTRVVAGETTNGVDFVLTRAMTISGVVVDESGVGVAGARVWGWPMGGGTGSGSRSDAQGRFVVRLAQSEPHHFEVEAEGFAKLEEISEAFAALETDELSGGQFDEQAGIPVAFARNGVHHAPGATDVRLVLKRPVLTSFVVVDAATSAPVTEFAVRLEWKRHGLSSRSGGEPEYPRGRFPNGEFECEADPLKHTYVITAPGYGPARGEIVHDSPTTRRCLVRLSKGGSLLGRVTVDGKPVEDAQVILRETTLAELYEGPVEDENSAYWNEWEGPWEPFLFDGRVRKWSSDAQGQFRFDSLEEGEYRLEILTSLGERRSLEPVVVQAGTPTDLGKIELLLAGTIEGRVLTPPGTSPAGLDVSATVFDVRRSTTTDSEGKFRIPLLPAGRAHVHVANRVGVLVWFPTQHLDLAADETKFLVLDASACAGATLSITARIDGKPAANLRVDLYSSADGKRGATLHSTDKQGVESGWTAAMGEADVVFEAPSRMSVAWLPKAARLTPGAVVKLDLDLAVGQLAFEWPELPSGEKLGQVEIEGRRADRAQPVHAVWFRRQGGFDADIVRRSEQRCEFRWVEPGECEWTVRVISTSATDNHIERYYRRSATVVAGALAECVLTPEHRIEPPPQKR
jgi:protocatechuate 3,4-dioxygenase beta subunit